jgi:hypothetical protein
MAVNGQEKIGDKPREYLYHQAVLASGKKMIDLEMSLPPAEEFLNFPAEHINIRHLFCGEIKTVGDDPVSFIVNDIPNEPNGLLSLIDTLCAQ